MTQAISVCGPRGEMVPVEGIRLRKEGDYTIVDAEIGGTWVEVIRERSDGQFCHMGLLRASEGISVVPKGRL